MPAFPLPGTRVPLLLSEGDRDSSSGHRERKGLPGWGGRGPPRGRSHAGGLGGLKEGHLPSQVHTRMSRVPAVALAGLPPEGAPAPSAPTPGAARPWAINAVTQQIDATISSQLPLGLIFYRLGDQSPHT